MKLDFMIVSLPRSGTTWAANFLTTEKSICWHDATSYCLPEELDSYPSSKSYRGIACTGAWLWKDWVEDHLGRVLILDRDPDEINKSLIEIGMPPMSSDYIDMFKNVKGYRMPYTELFDNPKKIWEYLLPNLPFDAERHEELLKMNIQPIDRVMAPDADYIRRAISNLHSKIKSL